FLTYFFEKKLSSLAGEDAVVLHVSPEKGISDILKNRFNNGYVSVDISTKRQPTVLADVTKLGFKNDSFDMVLCFAVLEHISDDSAAISEIMRVIKPNANALITVPMDWSVEFTQERKEPDSLEHFHYRLYGRDFLDKLKIFGFAVEVINSDDVVEETDKKKLQLNEVRIILAHKPVSG
ncbi:MAG: methyltransferase domain-containing protein, partial [Planctomycetota bacterium]